MSRLYQLLAAIFFIILFFYLFPWYQFIINPDGISYINVAQRISRGEYYYSLNGCWSPLSSWILVPFIKAGFDPVLSLKYINGILGLLSLFCCNALINKFNIHNTLKKILPFFIVVILIYYVFYELCADLLQLFFILLYLNLVLSKNFIENNYKIIFAAAMGAFAYYAKAYNLPFFLAHFSLATFILLKKNKKTNFTKVLVKKIAIAFTTFILLVSPYIITLSHKYGFATISNASKLNISWVLTNGASGMDSKRIMAFDLPYTDATSTWDEPTYSQQKFITPFTSIHYFLVETKVTFSNFIKFGGFLNGISIFAFVILVGYLIYLYKKKKELFVNDELLLLTTMLYPAGYLFILLDSRYFWLLPISILLMSAILISWLYEQKYINKIVFISTSIVIFLSFLLQPIMELRTLKNNNKDVYEIANIFEANKIKGNYFSNYTTAYLYAKGIVLSYLTKSKFYGPYILDYDFNELMISAKKYNINYYIYFYDFPFQKEMFLQSQYAKAAVRVYDQLYPGLIVVQFK